MQQCSVSRHVFLMFCVVRVGSLQVEERTFLQSMVSVYLYFFTWGSISTSSGGNVLVMKRESVRGWGGFHIVGYHCLLACDSCWFWAVARLARREIKERVESPTAASSSSNGRSLYPNHHAIQFKIRFNLVFWNWKTKNRLKMKTEIRWRGRTLWGVGNERLGARERKSVWNWYKSITKW